MQKDDEVPEWVDRVTDLLVDPEQNWDLFTLSSAAQWASLPEAGGWLDQSDSFLHDIGVFSRRITYLKRIRKRNALRREDAERRLGIRDLRDRFFRGR